MSAAVVVREMIDSEAAETVEAAEPPPPPPPPLLLPPLAEIETDIKALVETGLGTTELLELTARSATHSRRSRNPMCWSSH